MKKRIFNNYLKACRNKTPLTQQDIAALLGKKQATNLSLCEKGKRKPALDVLVMYVMLCRTTSRNVLRDQYEDTEALLQERIPLLIEKLKTTNNGKVTKHRIEYLEDILNNLIQTQV